MALDPASSVFAGPADTPEGRLRNLELNRQFSQFRAPGHTYLDDVLRRLGVLIDGGFDTNTMYRLPDVFLQLGAKDFEFPMADRPANLHFTGPIPHRHRDLPSPAGLQNLDDSWPIIFVTQGTLANFDFNQLIHPTIAGLAKENVQVVVTAGGSATEIISAANAIVEPYVSYELILSKTDVFVTNGGSNGVQQAISYEFPSSQQERARTSLLYHAGLLEWHGYRFEDRNTHPHANSRCYSRNIAQPEVCRPYKVVYSKDSQNQRAANHRRHRCAHFFKGSTKDLSCPRIDIILVWTSLID